MKTEMIELFSSGLAVFVILLATLLKVRRAFVVPEGRAGLLYHDGQFAETLNAGRHVRWGGNYVMEVVDFRKASLNVPSQEVLTSDGVKVKLNLLLTCQMTDPLKANRDTHSWQGYIFKSAQLALRAVIGSMTAEYLLNRRADIAASLLAYVQPNAAKNGIHILAVEVKDVMLSTEPKRAFAEVLEAKQEGHAAREGARGENALLNLANPTHSIDGNPSLMNLRLLQTIGEAHNGGNTLVAGMPAGFMPVRTTTATPKKGMDET